MSFSTENFKLSVYIDIFKYDTEAENHLYKVNEVPIELPLKPRFGNHFGFYLWSGYCNINQKLLIIVQTYNSDSSSQVHSSKLIFYMNKDNIDMGDINQDNATDLIIPLSCLGFYLCPSCHQKTDCF